MTHASYLRILLRHLRMVRSLILGTISPTKATTREKVLDFMESTDLRPARVPIMKLLRLIRIDHRVVESMNGELIPLPFERIPMALQHGNQIVQPMNVE